LNKDTSPVRALASAVSPAYEATGKFASGRMASFGPKGLALGRSLRRMKAETERAIAEEILAARLRRDSDMFPGLDELMFDAVYRVSSDPAVTRAVARADRIARKAAAPEAAAPAASSPDPVAEEVQDTPRVPLSERLSGAVRTLRLLGECAPLLAHEVRAEMRSLSFRTRLAVGDARDRCAALLRDRPGLSRLLNLAAEADPGFSPGPVDIAPRH